MQNSCKIPFGSLTGFLVTHNPFYLLSALLILVGLHKSLSGDSSLAGGWLLMGVLVGYTLLLVAAGYVIIRFGQVWEDARMILLVIVLLFVALSVSFDKNVLTNPLSGARFLLLGLAFAILASEAVFDGLGIRLAARYRIPFYLVLGLLFFYPWGLARLSISGQDAAMAWGVFLFPVAAAIVLLTLLPAARSRGADEPDNGTPWPWPWFPWTLFGFLMLAIALRSYSLSMAFETAKGMAVSFKPYFLAPLPLVASLLLLEMGIANGSRRACAVAQLLPVVVLLMSLPGEHLNPLAAQFLRNLTSTVGSPLQLGVVALGIFYGFVWLRGLRFGEIGLIACVALASMVDQETIAIDRFTEPQLLPLTLLGALELPWGLWRRSSWRVIVGAAACLLATSESDWSTDISPHSQFVLWHAAAIAVLALATIFNDHWARVFRHVTLPLIPAAAVFSALAYEVIFPEISRFDHAGYLAGLCAVAYLYWRRQPDAPQMSAMLASAASLGIFGARGLYLELKLSPLERGLPWLASGLAALAAATLMSLVKGGILMNHRRTPGSADK